MSTDYYTRAQQTPELKLLSMISSAWVTKIIYISVKKGLFNQIHAGFNTLAKLQNATNIETKCLARVLAGLSHLNLIHFNKDQSYQLTELGHLLTQGENNNFHHMALLWGEEFYNSWGEIEETIVNNKPGFDNYYNKNLFAYLQENAGTAANFDMAMSSLARFIYPSVAEKIHLEPGATIADIGGGNGFMLAAVLTKNPQAKGILFDSEEVVARVKEQPPEFLNDKAITVTGGNFFKSVPGVKNYLLANILHDWDDGDALKILCNIKAAAPAGASIYIVEMLLDHQQEPHLARSTDLNMMLLTGGRERTLSEIELLLKTANFKIEWIENIKQMTCLIKAVIS